MKPAQLILRGLTQHRVPALLTTLNVAVGLCLVSIVLMLRAAADTGLIGSSSGHALVIGPPGSRLELVLNSVFHRGKSAGLLPYTAFEQVERHPSTQLAVPLAVGDTFRGFRVVATTPAAFDPRVPIPPGATVADKLRVGRVFRHNSELLARQLKGKGQSSAESTNGTALVREAVVGARVARELGLELGDRIEPSHGVQSDALGHSEHHLWTVVGIARATHTPADGVVWVNLESFLGLEEHSGGVIAQTAERGISAAWVFPRAGVHKVVLLGELNKRNDLAVADVPTEVAGLLDLVGGANRLLLLVAALVVGVGVSSVGLGVYGSVTARRRELSLLRVLGARRSTVLGLVVGEALVLTTLGGLLGMGGAHLGVGLLAGEIEKATALYPIAGRFASGELWALVVVVAAGAIGGLLPAWRVYREDAVVGLGPVV